MPSSHRVNRRHSSARAQASGHRRKFDGLLIEARSDVPRPRTFGRRDREVSLTSPLAPAAIPEVRAPPPRARDAREETPRRPSRRVIGVGRSRAPSATATPDRRARPTAWSATSTSSERAAAFVGWTSSTAAGPERGEGHGPGYWERCSAPRSDERQRRTGDGELHARRGGPESPEAPSPTVSVDPSLVTYRRPNVDCDSRRADPSRHRRMQRALRQGPQPTRSDSVRERSPRARAPRRRRSNRVHVGAWRARRVRTYRSVGQPDQVVEPRTSVIDSPSVELDCRVNFRRGRVARGDVGPRQVPERAVGLHSPSPRPARAS